MATIDEYLTRPVAVRLARLRSTPDEISRLLADLDEAALCRRPDAREWSPPEIVCHLRDVEELFLVRFQTILAVDDPQILTFGATPEALAAWGIGGNVGHPLDPDRWAEDRQYERHDPTEALRAFARRRHEVVPCSKDSPPGNGGGAASIRPADVWTWANGWRASPATTTITSVSCGEP
jgi:hypothetical protein